MTKVVKTKERIIAGLDIGTTKAVVIIGIVQAENQIDIVGIGTAANTGMKQGVVVNIEATTEAIRKAREEAELMSGYQIQDVWVGIAGTHIRSFDSRGMVAIKDKEVSGQDILRVLEAAKTVAVPHDSEVLHVLPREYKIDEQDGIWDPIGMSGVRLESSVHIVTAGKTALQNTIKCAQKAGLKPVGFVLDQLASSLAILSEDEKHLGVAVVDMGGGTSDTIIYVNGSVAYTSVLPVGGSHFTHDVAVGLRTPHASAEKLKEKYGCALSSLVNESEVIEVEGVGGRKPRTVLRRNLCEVIEPRAEETLNLIHNDIIKSKMVDRIGSGIVFTGGASELDGFVEMGEFIFEVPVRRAAPTDIGGLTEIVRSPRYATAVGLLRYALEQEKGKAPSKQSEINFGQMFSGWGRKIRDLLGDEI